MKDKIYKIKNKKASFNYEFIKKYICGIVLFGSEIKSIRLGKANFTDSYCYFNNYELYIKNFHISEYENASYNNHEPLRDKKLLLEKKELIHIKDYIKKNNLTIVPVELFINEKGLAKIEISIAKGKKLYDKREVLKENDDKKYMNNY
jgi:SsrA-binding protein